jgi:hypothetical protein
MIEAYKAGIPGGGRPFPDGSKIAKIAWQAVNSVEAPFDVKIPGAQTGIGCMVKDSTRFADGGGWGYAQFDYNADSGTFAPNTSMQKNDAKCGVSCHSIVEAKNYIFTTYEKR